MKLNRSYEEKKKKIQCVFFDEIGEFRNSPKEFVKPLGIGSRGRLDTIVRCVRERGHEIRIAARKRAALAPKNGAFGWSVRYAPMSTFFAGNGAAAYTTWAASPRVPPNGRRRAAHAEREQTSRDTSTPLTVFTQRPLCSRRDSPVFTGAYDNKRYFDIPSRPPASNVRRPLFASVDAVYACKRKARYKLLSVVRMVRGRHDYSPRAMHV